jgi:hypothetical protein
MASIFRVKEIRNQHEAGGKLGLFIETLEDGNDVFLRKLKNIEFFENVILPE